MLPIALQIFIACCAIQLLYYALVFFRLNFVRGFKGMPEYLPPVSVVICAKNEAQNLIKNLKVVLIQQHPQFEVIVVNDQSTDNTVDVLVDYYMRNKNLKVVNIAPGEHKPYAGKKYALLKGIEAAVFDTIVVTDADCKPSSTLWLAQMAGAYMADTEIVLGHSPYEKQPDFLNKLIRYENFITAMQYFGFAKLGLPYMGVGRNLSYKKSLLQNFKGFEKHKNVATGDDDLFINAVATSKNTELCVGKDAFTLTKPETTFGAWLNQKKRHLRSGFKYRLVHQLLLFLFALSNFALYISFTVVLAMQVMPLITVGLFLALLLVKLLITFRVYKKLGSEDLRWLMPVLDVAYTGYLLIIFFLLLLKPKDNWKI